MFFLFPTATEVLMEVQILPISLERMYLKQKAELVCEVNRASGVGLQWFNESDAPLQQKVVEGKTTTATVEITYEEWIKGINWSCEASIPNSIDPPIRKNYEKKNGECMFSCLQNSESINKQ